MTFHVPEKNRVRRGAQASNESYGNNGAFFFPPVVGKKRPSLFVIASDGEGWEHVSVSSEHKCPSWEDMCFIKNIFWGEEDTVIQFHPKKSDYVNQHPYCLHLWRPTDATIPTPPSILVGLK